MPITVFMISGILTGILTSLTQSGVRVMWQEYRNHQERQWRRRGLAERMSEHHGVPYEEIKPGKHRLDDSSAAHELCTDEHPCAYRGRQNGMVHAEFYIERAQREAEYEPPIPWPREEDVYEPVRMTGLLCGYETPSNFPGLSTPSGSNVAFTAASTSMPRSPISVGR
jgi:hypothetical protein